MSSKHLTRLAQAMLSRSLIEFCNRFESDRVRGYVLDIGPRFVLVAIVSDRFWFDGFSCFRIRDLSAIRDEPRAEFIERALELRGEKRPERPPVDLADKRTLLLSAAKAFPLVTLHYEKADPDVCFIGRVFGVGRSKLKMLEIGPGADWSAEATAFSLSGITRIEFGADYEDALYLVGGEPEGAPQPWAANG